MKSSARPTRSVRTVFLSDVHLGYRGCQADYLVSFLAGLDTQRLVLVGDIIDLWSLKRVAYWPASHQAVLQAILDLARRGVSVVFIPGNHDEGLRELCGGEVAGIEIRRDLIHVAADGRRYLVVHGDDFDQAVKFSRVLKAAGESLYDVILWMGRVLQAVRRRCGFGYWSLATWIKGRLPDARRYIETFERAAAHEAGRHGLDGVICGHIHQPGIRDIDGVRYCNDGDWVEHCSALVEDHDGTMFLTTFTESRSVTLVPGPRVASPLDVAA
jgi:UDP-2,3-diacylglucosamine pyrophosphatase LpxH